MDKFADVLKVFIEKHLIPTVISVAGAIMLLLYLPTSYWAINKIGNMLFLIIAFCCFFLFVQLLIIIGRSIKNSFEKTALNKYHNKQIDELNNKAIQKANSYVDSLLPKDKDILLTFIYNGNKILVKDQTYCCDYNRLLSNDNLINKSIFIGDIRHLDEDKYWIESSLIESCRKGFYPVGNLYQYKIKDQMYNTLKIMHDKQGRLGNF